MDTITAIINYFKLNTPDTRDGQDCYWFRKTREQCERNIGSPYDFDEAFDGLIADELLVMREKQTRSGLINIYFTLRI